jgi:hypothetical protein
MSRTMLVSSITAAVAILGTACVPQSQRFQPIGPRESTSVEAAFGKTWDAVIDYFAERNVPISNMDRASGFIAVEQLPVGRDGTLWASCQTLSGYEVAPTHAVYNIVVRPAGGDSSAATVRMTVRWTRTYQQIGGGYATQVCLTKGTLEDRIESAIKERADGKPAVRAARYVPPAPPKAAAPKSWKAVFDSAKVEMDSIKKARPDSVKPPR